MLTASAALAILAVPLAVRASFIMAAAVAMGLTAGSMKTEAKTQFLVVICMPVILWTLAVALFVGSLLFT